MSVFSTMDAVVMVIMFCDDCSAYSSSQIEAETWCDLADEDDDDNDGDSNAKDE